MRTNDGLELSAQEPKAVVRELHSMSVDPAPTDYEFMARTAARVARELDRKVRCDNAEHFVADLCEVGLLLN